MVVFTLQHPNQCQHHTSIFKKMNALRKEGRLCDLVVKSTTAKHHAHKAVLVGASKYFENLLLGPFQEANDCQHVEISASDAIVFAFLEYIYGEEPQVEMEDSLKLLHLADFYSLPELAMTIKKGFLASLDSAPVRAALKLLELTQDIHELKTACEDKVAANFDMCIDMAEFLELRALQLVRILRREDLIVSWEEVVVKALFKWFQFSKADRGNDFGLLLQHVDLQSLSSSNLDRLQYLSASMGPLGSVLKGEVEEALRAQKKRSALNMPDACQPKRRCLQHWSPDLGASSQAPQKVLPYAPSICWHDGAIYRATDRRISRWKPEDTESQAVAGRGARVNGTNDLGNVCTVSVSPEGKILVADFKNRRLLSFQNGSGDVLLHDVDIINLSCLPNGDVYLLSQHGRAVQRLVGSTLHPVIFSDDLSVKLQFQGIHFFVTKDKVIYLSDFLNGRVLRLNQGEAEPEVYEAPNHESSDLRALFVTEDKKIYVADKGQRKVWAFHPGDAAWTEVLTCPGGLSPVGVLAQGTSLYVSMYKADDSEASGIYEYLLPPKL